MGHSYSLLKYHVVFATKYRMPLILSEYEADLNAYIGRVIENKNGRMIEINGMEDHLHILLSIPASCSVATMVAAIKANSSSLAKELMQDPDFFWQSGYSAFSVSESQVPKVRRYIQRQKAHHATKSYELEIRTLFKNHGIEGAETFLKAELEEASPS